MELKTNYQYTYFIYPFVIKEEDYKKYVINLIKNKKYKLKFFDSFKNLELYKYFTPNIKQKMFQDFSFNSEKINKFENLSFVHKKEILKKQNCLIFDYILDNQIQGKTQEKDGIFFTISKIELICFKTGICFLAIKTHLLETNNFSDLLNFNYKFENINFENKNIKELKTIKIQSSIFNNMNEISEIIAEITGKRIENRKLDIDENLFLVYTYACVESNFWNKDVDFENIENEFVKLAEVKQSSSNINVDYDKLSILTNSSYMKLRANSKSCALICSSTDTANYTKLPEAYENQYLYTYIIALHQRYYLKKLSSEFEKDTKHTINRFIKFINNMWIPEITMDSFGQKFYKRCREKLCLEDMFSNVKSKYDIYYKKINIDKNKKYNNIAIILLIACLIMGYINISGYLFFK